MDRLLEELNPLAKIIKQHKNPGKLYRDLIDKVRSESSNIVQALDCKNAKSVLITSDVIDQNGDLKPSAELNIHRSFGMAVGLSKESDFECEPVITLPKIFQDEIDSTNFKKTLTILRRMLSGAEHEIIIASPFFDPGFKNFSGILESAIERGCQLLILTRELSDPESFNSKALNEIASKYQNRDNCQIVSWEKKKLGIHLKSMVVDSEKAYIGSANFTKGGISEHVELGIYIEGSQAEKIQEFIRNVSEVISNK